MGSNVVPSGELTFCHGKSPLFMGKSTLNGDFPLLFVCSPEGKAMNFVILPAKSLEAHLALCRHWH